MTSLNHQKKFHAKTQRIRKSILYSGSRHAVCVDQLNKIFNQQRGIPYFPKLNNLWGMEHSNELSNW